MSELVPRSTSRLWFLYASSHTYQLLISFHLYLFRSSAIAEMADRGVVNAKKFKVQQPISWKRSPFPWVHPECHLIQSTCPFYHNQHEPFRHLTTIYQCHRRTDRQTDMLNSYDKQNRYDGRLKHIQPYHVFVYATMNSQTFRTGQQGENHT